MDDIELSALLGDLESDRVERKSSISDNKKIRSTICALANDLPDNRVPGVLFIGVNDDGSCVNTPISDDLLKSLSNMRSDGSILPFPSMDIQKKTMGGCELAVITIEPSHNPPVRYNGRVFVRVGPTTAVASPEDERRLVEKRRSHNQPFDIQPVQDASIVDLDIEHFKSVYLPTAIPVEILEQNQRTVDDQLHGLRLISNHPENHPTNLGLILCGYDVRRFIPGCYIQFVRFDGTDMAAPIKNQKVLDGHLLDILRMIDELISINISVASDVAEHSVEIRSPDYPPVALQQIIRNAVMHRTYESTNAHVRIMWFNDRVEIQSPGGPFGRVTKHNFGQQGSYDYRNPNIAEAMKTLGYAQQFGHGIELSRRKLAENGNPALEFFAEDHSVLAVLRPRE